jgi:hypothetical protein
MNFLPFTLLLYTSLLAGQQVNPAAPPQELPSERIADTYSVYAAVLRNPLGIHPDTAKTYFVSDRTGQSYVLSEECAHAPEGATIEFSEAISDFRAQKGTVYRLENHFHVKEREIRLLSPKEEKTALRTWSRGVQPTDIIRLSNIGFSRNRSLAVVAVSHECGSRCGGENWRVFKRHGNEWVEQQQLGGCSLISGLPADSTQGAFPARTRGKLELLLIPRTIVSGDEEEESFTIRLVNTGSTSVAFPAPTKFCGDLQEGYVGVYHTMLPPIPKDYRQIGRGCVVDRFRRADVLADAKKWKTLAPGEVYDIVVSSTDLYLDPDCAYKLRAKYYAPRLLASELSALSGHEINVATQDVESEPIIVKPTNRRPQHSQ